MNSAPRLLPKLPRRAWIVLGGDLLSAIGSGMTLPFLVVYLHRVRGLDLELAGAALATIALAALPGNPIAGVLVDRIGSRLTLIFGLLVTAAGTVAIAFVTAPWHAFVAAATTGFGLATIWPAQDSLLAVTVTSEQRSSVFAVRHGTSTRASESGRSSPRRSSTSTQQRAFRSSTCSMRPRSSSS